MNIATSMRTFLRAWVIEFTIKVRKRSSYRARGCPLETRSDGVPLGPWGVEEAGGCGLRWMAETAFSVFKRLFGERVRARTLSNVVRELRL